MKSKPERVRNKLTIGWNSSTSKKRWFKVSHPLLVCLGTLKAMKDTLDSHSMDLTLRHLWILLVLRYLLNHAFYFTKRKGLDTSRLFRLPISEMRFYRAFSELEGWKYIKELPDQRKNPFVAVKYELTGDAIYLLRRVSTNMNEIFKDVYE